MAFRGFLTAIFLCFISSSGAEAIPWTPTQFEARFGFSLENLGSTMKRVMALTIEADIGRLLVKNKSMPEIAEEIRVRYGQISPIIQVLWVAEAVEALKTGTPPRALTTQIPDPDRRFLLGDHQEVFRFFLDPHSMNQQPSGPQHRDLRFPGLLDLVRSNAPSFRQPLALGHLYLDSTGNRIAAKHPPLGHPLTGLDPQQSLFSFIRFDVQQLNPAGVLLFISLFHESFLPEDWTNIQAHLADWLVSEGDYLNGIDQADALRRILFQVGNPALHHQLRSLLFHSQGRLSQSFELNQQIRSALGAPFSVLCEKRLISR